MVRLILTYFLSFIFVWRISAQGISVKASTDKKNYKVGDYIYFNITATADEKINVLQPNLKDTLTSISGLESIRTFLTETEEQGDKKIFTFKHILSKYDSGDVKIPPVTIKYVNGNDTLSALTNEVYFVVSTLKTNQQADIKDVKAPIKIPLDWRLIIIYSLIAIIIIVAGIYVYLYFRKKRQIKQGIIKVIEKESYEIAFEQLQALDQKKLWQQGFVKQYHSEITEIIRVYFEDRFEFPALEITTSELLLKLEQTDAPYKVKQIVSDFLSNADLVKFAKYIPMNNINEEMMKQALEIVNSTMGYRQAKIQEGSEYVQ